MNERELKEKLEEKIENCEKLRRRQFTSEIKAVLEGKIEAYREVLEWL